MAHGSEASLSVERLITELGESEDRAVAQLHAILYVLGEETTRTVLEETKSVEAAGGMLAPDGGMRTKGGIFFYLVRRRLPRELRHRIFRPSVKTIAEMGELRPLTSVAPPPSKRQA